MTKIKDLLFKDKKRKIITIFSLVLVVVLFSTILIPVFEDMNKRFKNNDELYSYMSGTWKYMDDYIIFENDKVYVVKDLPFYDYILDIYKTTKNIETVKNLTFEDCIAKIKTNLQAEESVSWVPKKGEVIIHPLGNCSFDVAIVIEIKKDKVLITDYTATNNQMISFEKVSNDTNLIIDELKNEFNEFKKNLKAKDFIPNFSKFKERVRNNPNTSSLVNKSTFYYTTNDDSKRMLMLGDNPPKFTEACVTPIDNGIMLVNDNTVSLNDLLLIIDVYLQDLPTYPGESGHQTIKEKIWNGEKVYGTDSNNAPVICSEFDLYGVSFYTQYFKYQYSYDRYIISIYIDKSILK